MPSHGGDDVVDDDDDGETLPSIMMLPVTDLCPPSNAEGWQ
jgi:hypothetical protein